MRLKRVRIFGFKTFADRAEIDIDGGLVAVVGPNGCGKSNLVDAILWGLAEGTPKQLRTATGQDVIFNGSTRRKAVGFAEVSLLFDNEDGALPVPTSEVTVTRRLTRAGDSEYSINRQPCRQRDVYELLADTGLGRSGYAIVSQKEIDQALSASAEDRRLWVDEAAGVQRYRARKTESLKRLAAAQQHLQRVSDVLRELEAQREPLREEAELARRYRTALDALRSVEIGLLVRELGRSVQEIAELEARLESAHRTEAAETKRAEEMERKAAQAAAEVARVDREIEEEWSAQQRGLTAQERAEADLRLAEQRLEGLIELERSLGEEAKGLVERLREATMELAALRAEETREREALERLKEELASVGVSARESARQVTELDRRLQEARALHARRLRLETEAEHRRLREREARRELKGIEASLPELETAMAEAAAALEAAHAAVREAQAEWKGLEAKAQASRRQDDEDANASRRLLSQQAALEGRRRGIEATIESHEGLAQGARAVLEATERGDLKGTHVPVGSAVAVGKELALAIETALGAAANDLIVDGPEEAKRAIEWLKARRAGRATFQPISLMRAVGSSRELERVLASAGVVGRASDLVEVEARYRPVIENLLGRVVVVERLDDALRLAKMPGWGRLVTLDGEVVHSSGAVTGGQTAKGSYGLVQRKADLLELGEQIEALSQEAQAIHDRIEQRAAARRELQAEINRLQAEETKRTGELEEARSFHERLRDEHRSTVRSQERLKRELEALAAASPVTVAQVDLPAMEAERDEAVRALAAASASAERTEETLREAEGRLQQARVRREGGERRVQAAQEAERHRVKRMTNLEPERERLAREIEAQRVAREQGKASREQAEARLERLRAEKQAHTAETQRMGVEARQARANAAAVVASVHQAELGRARAESKRATALERLVDEYGILEEQALAMEATVEVPADAATVAGRLRRELRAMGTVNLGAIEAYERLSERFEELTAQGEDIEGGIAQVRASIAELDGLTRERFLTTFEAVQAAFTELFQKLFGGGEGRLVLTDPHSVLESGIEIDVALPGKKRQRLELLSGGERALCACAFLFALLRVKPSPLVVLDEVDAPLDGRNVERFVSLLQEFSHSTQFIVVTHNPTTIEAAPVWLGVTMQEPGVSTLVPTRVTLGGQAAAPDRAIVSLPVPEPVGA